MVWELVQYGCTNTAKAAKPKKLVWVQLGYGYNKCIITV